jgi:hypothetical protein
VENIIRIIDILNIRNRLDRRTKNKCWKENSNSKSRFLLFNELPDCLLGFGFGDTVRDVRMLGSDGVFDFKLFSMSERII